MSFGIFRDLVQGSSMLLVLEAVVLLGDKARSERPVCSSFRNVPDGCSTAPDPLHSHEARSLCERDLVLRFSLPECAFSESRVKRWEEASNRNQSHQDHKLVELPPSSAKFAHSVRISAGVQPGGEGKSCSGRSTRLSDQPEKGKMAKGLNQNNC